MLYYANGVCRTELTELSAGWWGLGGRGVEGAKHIQALRVLWSMEKNITVPNA